jgi:hypothetical protein
MVFVRPKTQIATTWLSLVLAVLIALLPSAGMVMCVGHDGHIGLGATSEADACPCEHDTAQLEEPDALCISPVPGNTDEHPPCGDVALEAPEVFRDAKHGKKLLGSSDLPDDEPTSGPLFCAPHDLAFDANRDESNRGGAALGTAPPLLRQQLEHKRVVVLLI